MALAFRRFQISQDPVELVLPAAANPALPNAYLPTCEQRLSLRGWPSYLALLLRISAGISRPRSRWFMLTVLT